MDEYIKKSDVIDWFSPYNHIDEPIPFETLAYDIRSMKPVADVAPVRHGEWEWFEEWIPCTTEHPRECEDCGWRCGNCKQSLEDMVGGYWDNPDETPKLAYCPNCGAKMDGGEPA